jgi:predicted DNA-binding transcriptional regulator AlpA
MPDQLLSPGDVSEQLKITQHTLRQWRWLGKGPRWLKVGRHVRYRQSDLDAWLNNGADNPSQASA